MGDMRKSLKKIEGKTIKTAYVYTGGAYMEQDDRSLQLDFEDGTSFILEIRTRRELLEGEAIYYDEESANAKTDAQEKAARHVLRKL